MADARRQRSRLPGPVALLVAAVVALRLSTTRWVADGSLPALLEPQTVLGAALTGWSTDGSLGHGSAEALRQVPFAGTGLAAEHLGIPVLLLQIGWRVLLVCLAVAGAARVLDGLGHRGWASWGPGLVYGAGPVAAATVAVSPQDGVVAAALPWVLAPLLARGPGRGHRGWWSLSAASRSAFPLVAVGVAQPAWALLVLAAGTVAALARARSSPRTAACWVLLALASSSWWLAVLAWRVRWAPPNLLADDVPVTDRLGDLLAPQWPVTLAVLLAPLGLLLLARAARTQAVRTAQLVPLLLLAVAGAVVLLTGPTVVVREGLPSGPDGISSDALLAPAALVSLLGTATVPDLLAVAARRSWSPVVEHPVEALRRLAALSAAAGAATVLMLGQVLAAQERHDLAVDPQLPPVWQGLADWSASAPAGAVLVLPQLDGPDRLALGRALGSRPWAAPGSPRQRAGATAALDASVTRLADGRGGGDVVSALAATGARYVLLREDLPVTAARATPPTLVRWSLLAAGAKQVASWPAEQASGDALLVRDLGATAVPGASLLELEPAGAVTEHPGEVVHVAGGVAAGPALAAAGVVEGPVRLVDPDDDLPDWVSDDARRRAVDQRVPVRSDGPLLTSDQVVTTTTAPGTLPSPTASARLVGARGLEASSSAADLATGSRRVDATPAAAVDGNPFTAWQSARGTGTGQWWRIDFAGTVDLGQAVVRFVDSRFVGPRVSSVRIETDRVTVDREVLPGGELFLDVDDPATRMTITVTSTDGKVGRNQAVAISEVEVPGVRVTTPLVVDAGLPGRGWLLTAQQGALDRCGPAPSDDTATACSASLSSPGPDPGALRRVVVSPAAVDVTATAWVRPAATTQGRAVVDGLVAPALRVQGSSTLVPDVAVRPQAAADADRRTAWRAAVTDAAPTLELAWDEPATVTGLRLVPPDDAFSARPTQVRVEVAGAVRTVEVGGDGTVVLPAVETTALTVTVLDSEGPTSVDTATGGVLRAPVAVAEVELRGGPRATAVGGRRTDLGCGSGPALDVDGETVPTRVRASARELLSGEPVPATACRPVRLAAGETAVEVPGSFLWAVTAVLLERDGSPSGQSGTGEVLLDLAPDAGSTTRLATGGGAGVLATTWPAGTGWRASAGGAALPAVVLDGWRQGWELPAGTAEVVLDYPPGEALRTWTGTGLACWAGVLVGVLLALRAASRRGRPGPRHGAGPPRDQTTIGRST